MSTRRVVDRSAAPTLSLVRDGTIFVGHNTEIDFRTSDYKVWLTIKGDDAEAEAVAAALEAAFGGNDG